MHSLSESRTLFLPFIDPMFPSLLFRIVLPFIDPMLPSSLILNSLSASYVRYTGAVLPIT